MVSISTTRLKATGTLCTALLLGMVASLYYHQQHPEWLLIKGITTGMSFAMTVLCAGAVWLFSDGVVHFKPELQKSYRLLCAGIAVFGLAQLQYGLLVVALGWNFWLDSGLIAVPYLLFAVCMFMAMRTFAALLNIRGRTTSFAWASGTALAAATVFALLLRTSQPDNVSYTATIGLAVWDAVFVLFATILAGKIKSALGQSYAQPMSRLYLSLSAIVGGGLHFVILEILVKEGDWYYDAGIGVMPFFIASLMLLWAGYGIASINASSALNAGRVNGDIPIIDIIIYVAGLASIQSRIDGMLDPLRRVTSTLGPERRLTAAEYDTLQHVYTNLEAYLVTQEQLRNFTVQEIRALITHKFNLSEADGKQLWPMQ